MEGEGVEERHCYTIPWTIAAAGFGPRDDKPTQITK